MDELDATGVAPPHRSGVSKTDVFGAVLTARRVEVRHK